MNSIISHLFETNAMKIAPEKNPFWYTSGKIGPYYINTHFLFGNEQAANDLLSFIDEEKGNHMEMPQKLFAKILLQYEQNAIYHEVMDEILSFIRTNIPIEEIDYVSGGERRDWFFSYIVAYLLQKPHITIYKDTSTVLSSFDFSSTTSLESISGKKVLHVVDIITEASSYFNFWIPAIQKLKGEIVWSYSVVDRMQGGSQRLENTGIKSFSNICIDETLFQTAYTLHIINDKQLELLKTFYADPDVAMENFLKENSEFIQNALNSDEKTASRAKLCIENNYYHLS